MIFFAEYLHGVRKSPFAEFFIFAGALSARGADALLYPRCYYLRLVGARRVYLLAYPFNTLTYALERALCVAEPPAQLTAFAARRIFLRGAEAVAQLFELRARDENKYQRRRRALRYRGYCLWVRQDDRAYPADADERCGYPELTELIKQPGAEPRRRIHSAESGIAARRRERYSGAYAAERAARFAQSEAQEHDNKRRRSPGGAKVHDIKLRERCKRRAAGDGDAYNIAPAEPPSLFSFINERERTREKICHPARENAVGEKSHNAV